MLYSFLLKKVAKATDYKIQSVLYKDKGVKMLTVRSAAVVSSAWPRGQAYAGLVLHIDLRLMEPR